MPIYKHYKNNVKYLSVKNSNTYREVKDYFKIAANTWLQTHTGVTKAARKRILLNNGTYAIQNVLRLTFDPVPKITAEEMVKRKFVVRLARYNGRAFLNSDSGIHYLYKKRKMQNTYENRAECLHSWSFPCTGKVGGFSSTKAFKKLTLDELLTGSVDLAIDTTDATKIFSWSRPYGPHPQTYKLVILPAETDMTIAMDSESIDIYEE